MDATDALYTAAVRLGRATAPKEKQMVKVNKTYTKQSINNQIDQLASAVHMAAILKQSHKVAWLSERITELNNQLIAMRTNRGQQSPSNWGQ